MTREEHTNLIRQIREARNDEGALSILLATLADDYVTILSDSENITNSNNELTASNEKLRQHNYELFLKIGQPDNTNKNEDNNKNEDKKDSISDKFGLYK